MSQQEPHPPSEHMETDAVRDTIVGHPAPGLESSLALATEPTGMNEEAARREVERLCSLYNLDLHTGPPPSTTVVRNRSDPGFEQVWSFPSLRSGFPILKDNSSLN